MTNNSRRGKIPSEIGDLVDYLDGVEERLRTLEAPGGTQRAGSVAHAASLRTYAAVGADINFASVPNDNVIHYQYPGIEVTAHIPTGECLITASFGEARMRPDGSYVVGYVGFFVEDATGADVPPPVGFASGKSYTNVQNGLSISTGPQRQEVDLSTFVQPFRIQLWAAAWASTLNGTGASATFFDPSLVVQVIGAGRSV